MSVLEQEQLLNQLVGLVNAIKSGKASSYVILTDTEALVVNNALAGSMTSMQQLLAMPTVINDVHLSASFKKQLNDLADVANELHKQLVLNAKPKITA